MEKIQSAIAKARAARSASDGPDAEPMLRDQTAAPAPTPAMTPAATLAATKVDQAWAALSPFVPNAAQLVRNRIVTHGGGADAVDFDVMRTRLLQQMRANNWRRVAITSPGAGCGKTMLTLNLGFSLARQPDSRTVVVEMDLRRPSMARTLGLKITRSFSDVLKGEARFEEAAVCFDRNLAFAANQGPVRAAAELLSSAGVAATVSDIEARYNPSLMLLDLPPMLIGDDVMAFVGQVDCVLLVAAAELSTIKEIDACERDLASQTNVLGVVLNKCRYVERNQGYGTYG